MFGRVGDQIVFTAIVGDNPVFMPSTFYNIDQNTGSSENSLAYAVTVLLCSR